MVLLFLLDAIASTALYVTIKCGVWIVYNTANGVYYLYKKIKPLRLPIDGGCNSNTLIEESKCRSNDAVGNDASAVIDHDDDGIDNDNDVCIILSHEEYKKIKGE